MKKSIYLLLILVLVASCANEKKDLYERAVEDVRSNLKSPSSGKFGDYSEANVAIALNYDKDAPLMITAQKGSFYDDADEAEKRKLEKEYSYDLATVTGDYEAQNAFGVMLKGSFSVTFKRYEQAYFGSQKRDWEIIERQVQ